MCAKRTSGPPTSQFSMVAPRLRTALRFACAVFRVFAPLSPSAAAQFRRCGRPFWACPRASSRFAAFDCALRFARVCSPLQPFGPDVRKLTRGAPCFTGLIDGHCTSICNGRPAAPYGLQYSASLVQHGRLSASRTALALAWRCSGAADALWACPRTSSPSASAVRKAHLRCFPATGLIGGYCTDSSNGRPAAPYGLQYSRLSVQHGRSASFASSLAVLPASLGSSAAIAPHLQWSSCCAPRLGSTFQFGAYYGLFRTARAFVCPTGCAASFALIGVFVPACASLARYSGAADALWACLALLPFGASTATACFAHCARPSCAPLAAPSLPPHCFVPACASLARYSGCGRPWACPPLHPSGLRRLRPVSRTARGEAPSHSACSSCAPLVNSPSGLRRATVPQFAMVVLLRLAACSTLAHWAYYGLFPPQAAAFVRPLHKGRFLG